MKVVIDYEAKMDPDQVADIVNKLLGNSGLYPLLRARVEE